MQGLRADAPPLDPLDPGGRWRRLRLLRRFLFYGVVRAMTAALRRMPAGVSEAALAALGRLAWTLRRGDREVAVRQMAAAFPDLPEREVRRLARRSFTVFGRNLAAALRDRLAVAIADGDHRRLRRALDGPRPVLILTAHLGCWEQLGCFLAAEAGALGVMTANPHNRWVDTWLRRQRRQRGMVPFDRRREARAAARWLATGRPLAVLADHRAGADGLRAPWFGQEVPTVRGPVWLARRTGAAILPVGIRREGDGYRVLVAPEVAWRPDESDALLAARFNAALEELIRKAPLEWTWFHDRRGREESAS